MNNPNNLLNMMQTGGQASSAGGAALARVMQRKSDDKRLARQQRKEARRQKKGGLFGSAGSLLGGLAASALAGTLGIVSGGLALPLIAGVGAGLGKRVGEGLGAGKSKKYDSSGTVFGQQDFRDVEQASRDYTRGMGERALLAGGQAALTAGLAPGGGMYGKTAGKFDQLQGVSNIGSGTANMLGLDVIKPPGSPDPLSALSSGTFGDTSLNLNFPEYKSALSEGTLNAISPSTFTIPPFTPSTASTAASTAASNTGTSSASFGVGSPQIGYNQPLLDFFEDGGLAGYENGGFTAQGVLNQNLLDPTNQQLKLFQSFDPTQIQQAKTGAEQSLMSMTGGMGLSSAGGGFGAKQRAATSAIGAGQDMIGDVTEQASKDYESQVLGTAADLVAGGAEFGDLAPTDQSISQLYGVNEGDQTQMDEVTQFLQTYQGVDEININGNLHQWNPYSNPPTYRPV